MDAANGPGSVGNPAGKTHGGGILPRSAQWPDPLQRPQPSQSRRCPKGSPKYFLFTNRLLSAAMLSFSIPVPSTIWLWIA